MSATPPSSMPSRRSVERAARIVGLLIGFACFGALIVSLWRDVPQGDSVLQPVRIGPLIIAFVLLLASYALHAVAWCVLHAASTSRSHLGIDLARWAVSLAGKYAPGKVFHGLARVYLYADGAGASFRVASAFLTELLIGLTALAALGVAAFAVAPVEAPPALLMTLVAVTLAGAMGLLGSFGSRAVALVRRLFDVAAPMRISARPIAGAFLLATAGHAMLGCGLFALVESLTPLQLNALPVCIAALAAGGVAGLLAFFVPAGLGVREVTMAFILGLILPPPIATLASLMSRIWLTAGDAAAIVMGGVVLRVLIRQRGRAA